MRKNIWEAKFLSPGTSENIFILPKHLRDSLSGNKIIVENFFFQKFENHCLLASLGRFDVILISICDLLLSVKS